MKKWLGIFLACILVLNLFPALAEGTASPENKEGQDYRVSYDNNDLTIGNPTQMNGQFFTALWGSHTSDIDVRQLTAGYNLIRWDGNKSIFRFDHTVVSGATIGDDQNGNRRYLISLYKDLYYSDGTRISAWDYAFSVLLQASPLIEKLGGIPSDLSYLEGYEDYAAGRTNTLKGLRVINDNQIVFVVKKEALPYFYELSRFSFNPYPISVIAPGCKVYDSEEGAYIAGENPEENPFTEELLRKTILTPETGYLVHPAPGSGPYTILSFDGETARFEVNPWYKGDEDGSKPRIKNLTYTWAHNEDMIEGLSKGKYALLNKVTLADAIRKGLELCTTTGEYTRAVYPRTGLTYFYFLPGSPAVQSGRLRQALANCLNKTEFVRQYVGYFGLEADGLYGLGQWMYQLASGQMPYPEEETKHRDTTQTGAHKGAGWEEINLDGLTRYPFDIEQAAALLSEDGWNLNGQGESFVPGTDAVRYKQTEEGLKPLALTIAYTGATEVEQPLNTYFIDNLRQAGIDARLVPTTLSRIEEVFDGSIDEDYDLLYLGNNFSFVFNPSVIFSNGAARKQVGAAPDSIPAVHEELRDLSLEMDRTEPSDMFGYMKKWVAFQERLSETLPILPVYINVYFDFSTVELQNYWIADHTTWASAMIAARMSRGKITSEEMAELLEDYNRMKDSDNIGEAILLRSAHQEKTTPDASAGALAGFPKDIQDQIPAEYRTVNEFITATISDDYRNVKSAEIQFGFETKYTAGETVYLIFGIIGENETEWIVSRAGVLENGSVSVELQKDQLDKLAGKPFALVAVSKQ
jgi:ABC-type transport system substrate-binding protein